MVDSVHAAHLLAHSLLGPGAAGMGDAPEVPPTLPPMSALPPRVTMDSVTAPPAVAQAPPPTRTGSAPPLLRRRSGRFVAGVAGGLADHLGIKVLYVRIALAVLAVLNGAGLLAYGLLWIFVRQESTDTGRVLGRNERQQALGLVALALAAGLSGAAVGNSVIGWVVGPLGAVALGAGVVWREADEAQRRRWAAGARSQVSGGGRNALWRVL